MPKSTQQTTTPDHPAIAAAPTLAQAIAVVRRALTLRAHLAAAGAESKFRRADAILPHWVMRVVAGAVETAEDIARKREFVEGLHRYRFALDPHCQAMADAVLADEARRLISRTAAH